ncbi:hypothetical protein HPB49_007404 [Dermacentor silvarum]|uniref:Uncharacterized protein n=1 Tax=Dermacentor silvarum TaxID=543639 RepID=A0ACB8DBN3_DERSI|nr:hypothetical protein HPB49_007404 [Dermacentor silvarum]
MRDPSPDLGGYIAPLLDTGLAEMHSRSKHYSHRLRSGGGRSVRAPDPSEPSPYFDNSTSRNVTTSAGKAVFLPCKVRHLGDRTVSAQAG